MALIASVITDSSWILGDTNGNKIGIISFNAGKGSYLLVTPEMEITLASFDELEDTLGKIKIKERESIKVLHKDVKGYPICHESTKNVIELENGIVQYTPNGQSKKDFYAGYWVSQTEAGLWFQRVSISVDMYNKLIVNNRTNGPFKDKFEANFLVKKLNNSDNNKEL